MADQGLQTACSLRVGSYVSWFVGSKALKERSECESQVPPPSEDTGISPRLAEDAATAPEVGQKFSRIAFWRGDADDAKANPVLFPPSARTRSAKKGEPEGSPFLRLPTAAHQSALGAPLRAYATSDALGLTQPIRRARRCGCDRRRRSRTRRSSRRPPRPCVPMR